MRGGQLHPDMVHAIRVLAEEGRWSIVEIAGILDLSKNTVRKYLPKHVIKKLSKLGKRHKKIQPADVPTIRRMYDQGYDARAIADRFDVSIRTVFRYL